jgi:hypothetical protein
MGYDGVLELGRRPITLATLVMDMVYIAPMNVRFLGSMHFVVVLGFS